MKKTIFSNGQYIIESGYFTCYYAYVTTEKTSTANKQYITESGYIAGADLGKGCRGCTLPPEITLTRNDNPC